MDKWSGSEAGVNGDRLGQRRYKCRFIFHFLVLQSCHHRSQGCSDHAYASSMVSRLLILLLTTMLGSSISWCVLILLYFPTFASTHFVVLDEQKFTYQAQQSYEP